MWFPPPSVSSARTRRGGGGPRYGRDEKVSHQHQTYVHRRRHSPPPQHQAAIPSSVEKAARGVGNVAAAAAIGVRDVAAAAAAVGSNWLSTSPLSRRPGFLGGTSPSGPGRVGSGSHQKPPLSSSPRARGVQRVQRLAVQHDGRRRPRVFGSR